MAFKEYPAKNKYMTQSFKGLNIHERPGDGEWKQMLNLTADEYPVAKTRAKRKLTRWYDVENRTVTGKFFVQSSQSLMVYTATEETPETGNVRVKLFGETYNAYVFHGENHDTYSFPGRQGTLYNALVQAELQGQTVTMQVYVEAAPRTKGLPTDAAVIGEKLYLASETGYVSQGSTEIFTSAYLKQIVPIGKRLYTNTGALIDDELSEIKETMVLVEGAAELRLVNDEAELIEFADEKPTSPQNGEYWYNSANNGLYKYSSAQADWIAVTESYVQIKFVNEFDNAAVTVPNLGALRPGDAISMIGGGEDSAYIIHGVDNENHILTVNGVMNVIPPEDAQVLTSLIKAVRRMPVLDFICEHNNRIWGCRYGLNAEDEFVNEIYTCALGDPLNWFNYEGTAADAWTASVGEPGPWTGCCECGRYVLFFKEDKVFVVSGDEPANFGYEALDDWGVQQGSSKSITVIDNYVYYKSQHGVMRIGVNSYPVCVSRVLGYDRWTQAVGGTDGRKYYLSMNENGVRSLFVFDTETGIWTRENEPCEDLSLFVRYKNNLIAISAEETDTPCAIVTAYDAQAAKENYPASGTALQRIAWKLKCIKSQLMRYMTTSAIVTLSGEATVADAYEWLQGKIEDHTYFVKADLINEYETGYIYISNEKTTDLVPLPDMEFYNEEDFGWWAETGPIGLDLPDEKRIKTIQIRLKSGDGATLKVYAEYDEQGAWNEIRHENTGKYGTFRIAWTPQRRCGCFRLKLAGTGACVIYSIAIETEDAGDYV